MDNQNRTFIIDLIVVARRITPRVLELIDLSLTYLNELSVSCDVTIIHHKKAKKLQIPQSFNTYMTKKHSAARSRNIGIERTKNNALIFLDDDTLVNDEWAKDIRVFLDKEYLDIVCFNTGTSEGTFDVSTFQNGKLFKADTAGMGIKRSILSQSLKFDETLKRAEDCDFVTAAIRSGFISWFSHTKIFDQNRDSFIRRMFIKKANTFYLNKIFYKHFSVNGEVNIFKRKFIYFLRGEKINGNIYVLNKTLIIDQGPTLLELEKFNVVEKEKLRIIESD